METKGVVFSEDVGVGVSGDSVTVGLCLLARGDGFEPFDCPGTSTSATAIITKAVNNLLLMFIIFLSPFAQCPNLKSPRLVREHQLNL